jgi:hypothetical protein
MFRSVWSWAIPLVLGVAIFTLVLATTPPGGRALFDVMFGTPRGTAADAAAYAIGAAASLAFAVVLFSALLLVAIDFLLARRHRGQTPRKVT